MQSLEFPKLSESSDEPPPEGHVWQATVIMEETHHDTKKHPRAAEGELGNETLPPVLPLCACYKESPVVEDFAANMDQRGDPAPAGTEFTRPLVLKRPEVQQQPQRHQQQDCHVVVNCSADGELGEGAHGKVYAGMLCGRTKVAVKVIRGTRHDAMKWRTECAAQTAPATPMWCAFSALSRLTTTSSG
jgi:hypothetical protein